MAGIHAGEIIWEDRRSESDSGFYNSYTWAGEITQWLKSSPCRPEDQCPVPEYPGRCSVGMVAYTPVILPWGCGDRESSKLARGISPIGKL